MRYVEDHGRQTHSQIVENVPYGLRLEGARGLSVVDLSSSFQVSQLESPPNRDGRYRNHGGIDRAVACRRRGETFRQHRTAFASGLADTTRALEVWLKPLVDAVVDIVHCSQRRFLDPEFDRSDLNFAGWAKKVTGVPTISVGLVGLTDEFIAAYCGESSRPASLDELIRRLDREEFDLVAVGRALLQDPQCY